MEKWKKKAKLNLTILVFVPTIYLATLEGIQSWKTPALAEAKKYVTENFIGEKKKRKKKGMISRRRLILFYTVQQDISTFVPNFKIIGAVVPEKSLTQISLRIILEFGVRDGKNGKRRQNLISAS